MAELPTGVTLTEIAAGGPALETVRELLSEYLDSDAVKLCTEGAGQILATLPGEFVPPTGCLWLAQLGGVAAGCVALRGLDAQRCEMKRLYVRAAFRGAGLAGILVECAIGRARALGYKEMYLDTLPEMRAARLMYDVLGFRACLPYLPESTPGAECLVLDLTPPS
jgi:GNAT superfamily N-acetyltransferase